MKTNKNPELTLPNLEIGEDVHNNVHVDDWMDPNASFDVNSNPDVTVWIDAETGTIAPADVPMPPENWLDGDAPEAGTDVESNEHVDTWLDAPVGTADPEDVDTDERWNEEAVEATEAAEVQEETTAETEVTAEEVEAEEQLGDAVVVTEADVADEEENVEVIGEAPFVPAPEIPLNVMHTNVSWNTSLDGEGDLAISGNLAVFATGQQGDVVRIGAVDIPAGHENELCYVTYRTENNHSVGESTYISATDGDETVVIGNIERAPGGINAASGTFSPDANGGQLVLSAGLGSRPNNRGGVSAQGSFGVVCETPEPVEEPIEEPVEETTTTTAPPVTTTTPSTTQPAPTTTEQPTTTVEETTTTTEQPTTTTTQPVDTTPETTTTVPVETPVETLPETGSETVVLALTGITLIAAGAAMLIKTRQARGLRPLRAVARR